MTFNLTRADQDFIKRNNAYLKDMFSRWVDDLKDLAFNMPSDTEEERKNRDRIIDTAKFITDALNAVNIVLQEKEKTEQNKDFI
jgi:hypothetical protein